ncbi:MAG: tyrosine--tRNA ligase, partial [Eubacterium sp.]|nr:tyrosine--tRNA ligase [Eubacterium sp.]
KAEIAAKSIFGGGGSENMPETALTDDDFKDGKIDAISILVKAGLVPSRGEGRRAIEQNGVAVNGEKVTDIHAEYEKDVFKEEFVIRRGKKNFRKIVLA